MPTFRKLPFKDDLTGKRYGRWTVVRFSHQARAAKSMWLVKCDCGQEKAVQREHLVSGKSASCGCLRKILRLPKRTDAGRLRLVDRKRAHAAEVMARGEKPCSVVECKEDNPQPLARFHKNKNASDGHVAICKTCMASIALQRRLGISLSEKEKMVSDQGGRCASCRDELSPQASCTDHDHRTGAIREVLCIACNGALGMLKDSPARIRYLLTYAERHRQLKIVS